MKIRGYVLSGLLGLMIGIFTTAWATRAIPKIVSRSLLKTMSGMMEKMQTIIKYEADENNL